MKANNEILANIREYISYIFAEVGFTAKVS